VDFDYSDDDTDFRAEVRDWLASRLTDELRSLSSDLASGGEKEVLLRQQWERTLGEGGWIGIDWPRECGGRGVTITQSLIFAQEYAQARAPLRAMFGEGLLGPTLIHFGSDQQRTRFLPGILSGTQTWCQGFSEPGAGSDLASLRTRAILDGDDWVLDGQKIWTSQAQLADWIFVLARTEPDAPSHQGISFLLVPMDQPGIEIRPIRQITGTSEFCEVFFTGARTSSDLIVGARGDGWKVAMGTLGFERGTAFLGQQIRYAHEWQSVADSAKKSGALDDPLSRDALVQSWIELQLMRYNGFRTVTQVIRNGKPGPEASLGKLLWSQWHQRLGDLEMDLEGIASQVVNGGKLSEYQHSFLFSRAHTIYAGSSEVQRNIIGERILGLPR
jgi:alkylation response protein AidB-like acyl-CoA dehydrogenase